MKFGLRLITPPAVEPVSLDTAKLHLKVDSDDDDSLILGYISAAREYCEDLTKRAFYDQTWQLTLDTFPYYGGDDSTVPTRQRGSYPLYASYYDQVTIRLPRPSCVSVTSIKYLDLTGTQQTLNPASYYVDTNSEPARIVPAPGTFWPYTQTYLPGAVNVTYVAGSYGDGITVNNIPPKITAAILMLTSHLYENRSTTSQGVAVTNVPLSVLSLLESHRTKSFGFGNN